MGALIIARIAITIGGSVTTDEIGMRETRGIVTAIAGGQIGVTEPAPAIVILETGGVEMDEAEMDAVEMDEAETIVLSRRAMAPDAVAPGSTGQVLSSHVRDLVVRTLAPAVPAMFAPTTLPVEIATGVQYGHATPGNRRGVMETGKTTRRPKRSLRRETDGRPVMPRAIARTAISVETPTAANR